MLDELYIDGARFKAARRAASLAGVSPDYLTRWCREGWVEARQLAGGVWLSASRRSKRILHKERPAKRNGVRTSQRSVVKSSVPQLSARQRPARNTFS
jgi:hypothetical protein